MKSLIELIEAIPRPAMALSAVVGTLGLLFTHTPIPDAWYGFLGACSTFYFLQRAQEKAKRDDSNKPNGGS